MFDDEEAKKLLSRAAEIDGKAKNGLSLAELEEAAGQAGISRDAIRAAAREQAKAPTDGPVLSRSWDGKLPSRRELEGILLSHFADADVAYEMVDGAHRFTLTRKGYWQRPLRIEVDSTDRVRVLVSGQPTTDLWSLGSQVSAGMGLSAAMAGALAGAAGQPVLAGLGAASGALFPLIGYIDYRLRRSFASRVTKLLDALEQKFTAVEYRVETGEGEAVAQDVVEAKAEQRRSRSQD